MSRPPYPIGKRRRAPDGRTRVKTETGWRWMPKNGHARRRAPRLEIALPAEYRQALSDAADDLGGVTDAQLAAWVVCDWLDARQIRHLLSDGSVR
jgi:hypothetical protein